MTLNNPQTTQQALSILRVGDDFHFLVIFMLVLVLYIYFSEVKNKNWNGIASALTLYVIHWFVEIINGMIQFFSGHALWTVPTGTSFLILIGLAIELNLMFAIAGLAQSKLLPDDPDEKIFGIPKKLGIGIGNAALASIIEIFLVMTPAFVWVYWWWNALTVFIFVYIPFFIVSAYAYYWERKKQAMFIGIMAVIDLVLIIIFAVVLPLILNTTVI